MGMGRMSKIVCPFFFYLKKFLDNKINPKGGFSFPSHYAFLKTTYYQEDKIDFFEIKNKFFCSNSWRVE